MARFLLNGMVSYSTYVKVEGEKEPREIVFSKSNLTPRFVPGQFITDEPEVFAGLLDHPFYGRKFKLDEATKNQLKKKVVKVVAPTETKTDAPTETTDTTAADTTAASAEGGAETEEVIEEVIEEVKVMISPIDKFKDARAMLNAEPFNIDNTKMGSIADLVEVAKSVNVSFPKLEAKL